MNILITNSVPLNGGDEALLRATMMALGERFPGAVFNVLCSHVALSRRHLPDVSLYPDLEHTVTSKRLAFMDIADRLRTRVGLRRTPPRSARDCPAERRQVLALYERADVIIASAGGYLHDFYMIKNRLRGLELAASMGKKVILFGQSIGPFWRAESIADVRRVLPMMHRIYLREGASLQHLRAAGLDLPQAEVTADTAFLLRRYYRDLYVPKDSPVRKFGISFRNWRFPRTDMRSVVLNASRLCAYLLERQHDAELVFLSTCQGIPGYVDDSKLADEIVANLSDALRKRCAIDRHHYGPAEMIRAYSQLDAYIGMRLHGAILAMLGGTPAMALGYEEKTPGIFEQLGLSAYQVMADAPFCRWMESLSRFLDDVDDIRNKLPSALDHVSERAFRNVQFN